ncbi:unnamed protein product [Moneuplotes crassus]|uniref:Uncharacterized protein n=1 Tax=Euplotes crassus TaxID=5936 RepID=A0AAD1X8E9_EUPCR|nr:unnamed protein product [Moneuplotes crassus]
MLNIIIVLIKFLQSLILRYFLSIFQLLDPSTKAKIPLFPSNSPTTLQTSPLLP